ncbi:dfp2-like protein 11 [Dermatophagoides farinae]|uniref:Dfp2-like protein 11 n=1 Tax=Dermatophagoides farinae TaxID=6954 RepID=A0A9D4P6I3_DERFA|nr:dfp2-like protein 11 [Dermatophagoides farinae]
MSPIEMMIFGPSDVKGSSSYGGGNSMSSFSSINSGAGIGGSGSGYKSSMMTLSPFQSNLMDYGSGSSSSSSSSSPPPHPSSSSLYGTKGSAGGIGSNYQQQQQSQGPVSAAIQSKHSVQYIDVPYESTPIAPQTILVEANRIPLNIFFQSRSSNLNVETEHTPSPGSTQETSSEDEPHYLIHRVVKPVYQLINEIIKPYRKITQEIKPVEEDIQTIIARQIPSDNKYVPMNGQYKGGSPTTSPITIRPGSPIQQQTEIYQDTGSSFSGSGGYQSSQLKPNTISYVRPREPNSNDAELFLNAIRNEKCPRNNHRIRNILLKLYVRLPIH